MIQSFRARVARLTLPFLLSSLSSLVIASAGAVSLGSLGCGGSSGGAKAANITAGEMPAGESWTGVYYHPIYGYLHLVEQDTNAIGRWMRTDQSAWGEMSGTITGNVVHYTWKEHKVGQVGPSSESKGKGYFVYSVNGEGQASIKGEYGLGDSEAGSDWTCQKQARKSPDLKSIPGNEGAPRGGGALD